MKHHFDKTWEPWVKYLQYRGNNWMLVLSDAFDLRRGWQYDKMAEVVCEMLEVMLLGEHKSLRSFERHVNGCDECQYRLAQYAALYRKAPAEWKAKP